MTRPAPRSVVRERSDATPRRSSATPRVREIAEVHADASLATARHATFEATLGETLDRRLPRYLDGARLDATLPASTLLPMSRVLREDTLLPATTALAGRDGAGADSHGAPTAPGVPNSAGAGTADGASVAPGARTHGAPPAGMATPRGGAATARTGDEELLVEITDTEAAAQLDASWASEASEPLPRESLTLEFSAPGSVTLVFPSKPPPPGQDESAARQTRAAADDAIRVAAEAYQKLAAGAREHHEALLKLAQTQQRELCERAEAAIAGVDHALAPRVETLLDALEASRRAIADGADAAEATIDAKARHARRLIGGAVTSARRRIASAASGAVAQLPGIRTRLRGRFDSMYRTYSGEVRDSGTWADEQLRSEAKKGETRDAIPEGENPEAAAQVEARRRSVPAQLDGLAASVKSEADAQADSIATRIDAAAPGGSSIAASIEAFMQSINDSIVGAGDNKSLAARGNEAVDHASQAAYGSLTQQVKAAREAVQHARRSGEAQVARQRKAIFERVNAMRRTAREAMRAQAESALKVIAMSVRSGLPVYADAARRFETTLRGALPNGAAALRSTAEKALPTVTRTLLDGRATQETRLQQVGGGAVRGVEGQQQRLLDESDRAAGDFSTLMSAVADGLVTQLADSAEQQGNGFANAARSVASAADGFCQPIPRQYGDAITRQVAALDPAYDAEDNSVFELMDNATSTHIAKVRDPLPDIMPALNSAADAVDRALNDRVNAAHNALAGLTIDEDALMAAFRGLSPIQAAAVEYKYNHRGGWQNLRDNLREEHDATVGGLNDDEYNSCISALNGDAAGAARYELATTTHWYGNEGNRATQIVEGLSDADRRTLTTSRDWPALAASVRDGLPRSELDVFNAVAEGNRGLAGALRTRQAIDRAREANDNQALIAAVSTLGATGGDRDVLNPGEVMSPAAYRAAVQQEFAHLDGVDSSDPNAPIGPRTAEQDAAHNADVLARYATRDVTVMQYVGEGEAVPVTYTLDHTTSTLVGAIARGGEDSVDARAARILYESERPGGDKPDSAALENAVVDPRLNPALTPNLTDAQRAAARAEQDRIFQRYAEMAAESGVPGSPHNAAEARQLASERLRMRFGDSESDRLGAEYVGSIVTRDVPDPVVAMRYAMVGAGTDEALIHRTLQRCSRADIDRLRHDYNERYGGDMYADLGVYGRGSFGEVSGDDRLQVERELLGHPTNDRERAEVAMYASQQQLDERGIADVNAGSAEERALIDAQANMRAQAGGHIAYDEFGRPTVVGGQFDAETGDYTGHNRDAFGRAVNLSQATVDSYVARSDRIAGYFTTGIAILGAVVAAAVTVATGGLAAPLLMAAIAAGTGLASMAANAAIRGGRYGWEQAATDLGMTAVQALTAGVGAQLGAASQLAAKSAQAAGATASQMARMGVMSAARIGAITGGIGGLGNAALNEHTWDRGILSGLGGVLEGGAKGALSGAVTGAVSSSLENIGGLGNHLSELSATGGGVLKGGLSVLGRGVGRSAISGVSSMTGRGSELLFDSATGRFHGDRHEVLASLGEAGQQAALQGFFEGGAEAGAQGLHNRRLAAAGAEIARERERTGQPALDADALRGAAGDLLLRRHFEADPHDPAHVQQIARDGSWDGVLSRPVGTDERASGAAHPAGSDVASATPRRQDETDMPATHPLPSDDAPLAHPPRSDETSGAPQAHARDDAATSARLGAHEDGEATAARGARIEDEPNAAPRSRAGDDERDAPTRPRSDSADDDAEPPTQRRLPVVDDETGATAFPEGMTHIDLDSHEAAASYQRSIAEDPSREVGIYYDPKTGDYAVVQGRPRDVDHGILYEGDLASDWRLVEHYHPGGDVGARYASAADFETMLHWQRHAGESPREVSTRIRWIDPESHLQFTTDIGFQPGEAKPYWTRYRDQDGNERVVRFADPPWQAGSDYHAFVQSELSLPSARAAAERPDELPPPTRRGGDDDEPLTQRRPQREASEPAAPTRSIEHEATPPPTESPRAAAMGDAEMPASGAHRADADIVPHDAGGPSLDAQARLRAPVDEASPTAASRTAATGETEAQQRMHAEDEALRRQLDIDDEPPTQRQPRALDEPSEGRRGTADRTAGGIAGSRLAGDAAQQLGLPKTHMGVAESAVHALSSPGGTLEGRVRVVDHPDRPMEITLLGRTPHEAEIAVRLQVVDELPRIDGEMPAARYEADPDRPGAYVVKIARGTPASETQRVLAHEFAEIRSVHGTDGQQIDALGRGGKAGRLSPHDEGRMAELDVMGRQMAALDGDHPQTAAARRRMIDETQRLAEHLGLLGDSDAAGKRLDLVRRTLGDGPARALLEQAVATADQNPFLQRPSGKFGDDLALLARRLEHARSLGDSPETVALRQRAIVEQAAQVVMRDRLVVQRRVGDDRFEPMTAQRRVEALQATLPPEQRHLLDLGIAQAKRMPPMLAEGSRAPTPGYEARFSTEPVPRAEFDVPGDQRVQLRVGGKTEELSFDQAVSRRQRLLDEQRALRVEMEAPGTSPTRRAELKREIEGMISPINKLSEALGTAAGRRFIDTDPVLSKGRILELPREGAGIPDLIVEMPPHPNGRLVLVECKGGDAELGTRQSADKRLRVQQGRREYLESLAQEMGRSRNAKIRDYGERLRLQLAAAGDDTRYLLVRQPFDIDGDPTSPEIGEFNIKR